MIDNIIKIEDFKAQMEKHKLQKENLRVTINKQQLNQVAARCEIILTIPRNDKIILKCIVARRAFMFIFMDDPDSQDYKEYLEWLKISKDKIKSIFGEEKIIEGNWLEK